MSKFKPGDIVNYAGRQLRVRMAAFIGFECDAGKGGQVYDLTDIDTGDHLSIPKQQLEEGISIVENVNNDETQFEEVQTGIKAKLVGYSKEHYWEQMKDKINVTPEQQLQFDAAVKQQKQIEEFNNTKLMRKLWNKVISLGKDQ